MKRSTRPAVFSTLTMQGHALPDGLVVRRVQGHEGAGQLFEYRVEAIMPHAEFALELSMNPGLDLDQIRDTLATVTINLENIDLSAPAFRGTGVREISGLITEVSVLGVGKSAIVYEFVLRPWIWPATLRRNSRVWNDSVLDCLSEILRPYGGQIAWRIENKTRPGANPRRDLIRQAWETDWQFFMRLCEEFGYVVWFEHRDATHVLVIADNASAYLKHDAPFDVLPFRPNGGHIDSEHVTEFVYSRAVTVGAVTVHDHSYMSPRQNPGSLPYRAKYSAARDASSFRHETYAPADFAQPQTRSGMPEAGEAWQDDALHLARVKLEAMRCMGLRARGSGPLRGLQSGKTFRLADYPHHAANRAWLVTQLEIDIRELPATSGTLPQYTSECTFEAVPVDEPYRMPQVTPRPRIDGYEYAVIVSPDQREIWIDEHNRVLIQYPWDREEQYDGRKSIWVRLATQWQGEQMGFVAHARRGDAVLVAYINGDPDRPVIAAFVPDRDHSPPWALPENQALSGMRSRSLEHRAQSNHVALDDTPGRLQAQIASDHGKSSISLGYNTRIDGNAGRQEARGEGIEARTDLWGVLRAGKGWLLTSFARESAAGKVKDMGETHSRLTEARGFHEEIARTARQHGAQDATDNQEGVANAIKEANAGLRGNGHGDFPEIENPDIVISSAANVHASAEGSTHIASREHIALTTGGNIAFAAFKSFFASVQRTISLFASKAITLSSATGGVRIESRTKRIDMVAQEDITQTSTKGWFKVAASKGIELKVNGTTVRITEEGVTFFTGGQYLVHAANHATDAPVAPPVQFPVTAENPGKLVAHHVLVEDNGGFAMANQPFRLTLDDGQVFEGVTNALGELPLVTSNATAFGLIELMSQTEPEDVIGLIQTTVHRDADTATPPLQPEAMKRTVQAGGKTVSTPDMGSTSAGIAPDYLTCDPMNFGLRRYRYIENGGFQPVSIHTRRDIEYPVAKSYTAAIKKSLTEIDWQQLRAKSSDEIESVILPAIRGHVYAALADGVFGIPRDAMPGIVLDTALQTGAASGESTVASFDSQNWRILIRLQSISNILRRLDNVEIMKGDLYKSKIAKLSLDDAIRDLAVTIYHEARHCQQYFWMASLYFSHTEDYSKFSKVRDLINLCFHKIVLDVAGNTKFPNDDRALIGINHLFIFWYWWEISDLKNQPGGAFLVVDSVNSQTEAAKIRGVTMDQVAQMAAYDPGYFSQYHEEDAYATEDAVRKYWTDGASTGFLNPGVCTSRYESALRKIGVQGNG